MAEAPIFSATNQSPLQSACRKRMFKRHYTALLAPSELSAPSAPISTKPHNPPAGGVVGECEILGPSSLARGHGTRLSHQQTLQGQARRFVRLGALALGETDARQRRQPVRAGRYSFFPRVTTVAGHPARHSIPAFAGAAIARETDVWEGIGGGPRWLAGAAETQPMEYGCHRIDSHRSLVYARRQFGGRRRAWTVSMRSLPGAL